MTKNFFCAGFFRLGETFRNFFKCLQRVPLHFFPILQKNGCSKTPKGPLLHFRHYATYPRPKNIEKIQKNLIFIEFFPHAGTVEENN